MTHIKWNFPNYANMVIVILSSLTLTSWINLLCTLPFKKWNECNLIFNTIQTHQTAKPWQGSWWRDKKTHSFFIFFPLRLRIESVTKVCMRKIKLIAFDTFQDTFVQWIFHPFIISFTKDHFIMKLIKYEIPLRNNKRKKMQVDMKYRRYVKSNRTSLGEARLVSVVVK